MKKSTLKKILITVFVIVLIVITVIAQPTFDEILSNLVTSTIASLFFLIFTSLNDEIPEAIGKLDNNVTSTKNSVVRIEELMKVTDQHISVKFGITKIECREEFSYDFWKQFLNKALSMKSKRFIISGRTLNRWLESEIKDDFKKALIQLIANKTEIIFVIYENPGSDGENHEKDELKTFLFESIFPELVNRFRKKDREKIFKIYEVTSLSYLFTAIESEIVVAQYFQYSPNTKNLMLVFDSKSEYALRYDADFSKIISHAKPNKWLSEYQQNGGKK